MIFKVSYQVFQPNGHFLDGISVLLREDSSPELRLIWFPDPSSDPIYKCMWKGPLPFRMHLYIGSLEGSGNQTKLRHVHSFNYESIDVFLQQVICPGFGAAVPNHYICALLKLDNHLANEQPLAVWEMSSVYCSSVDGMCTRPSDCFYRRIG